jgi:HlyD family secretion protein
MRPSLRLLALLPAAAVIALWGCSRAANTSWQGYLEGDFVYVSSPLSGRLEKLSVAKGARVAAGAPLFQLEHASESDAEQEASQMLDGARAQLIDLKKGSRPEEIEALVARLAQARAAEENSRLELARQDALLKAGAVTASDHDKARFTHDADAATVDEDAARLATARLGGRADAIKAAGAAVRAEDEAVAKAHWNVEQKAQSAPTGALVYDTLYREGEFVAAGSPVVVLLPPANIKVRFFVDEPDYARLKAGDHVEVGVPGLASPLEGTVSYLSQQPEYTPPVLYNRDNRSKLVYMAEAVFDAAAAADLHPGQPVDVALPAK